MSRAIPAAVCGIIIGRSTNPWTRLFPGKFHRAKRYAKGIPKIAHAMVAQKAERRVRKIDAITSLSAIVDRITSGSALRIILRRGTAIRMTSRMLRDENANLNPFLPEIEIIRSA